MILHKMMTVETLMKNEILVNDEKLAKLDF